MSEKARTYRLDVPSAEAFEAARARGFDLAAPAGAGEGARVTVYLNDTKSFAAVGEVAGGRVRVTDSCPPGDYEAAGPLGESADFDQVRLSVRARAKGRPRPPGAPANEAEKRPPIPARVRKPKSE